MVAIALLAALWPSLALPLAIVAVAVFVGLGILVVRVLIPRAIAPGAPRRPRGRGQIR